MNPNCNIQICMIKNLDFITNDRNKTKKNSALKYTLHDSKYYFLASYLVLLLLKITNLSVNNKR